MFFSKMHKSMDKNKPEECSVLGPKLSDSTRRHLRRKRAKRKKAHISDDSNSISTDIKKNNVDIITSPYDYNPPALKNIKKILDLQECLTNTLKTKDCEVANLLANSKNQHFIHCEHTTLSTATEENFVENIFKKSEVNNVNFTKLINSDDTKQENNTFSTNLIKESNTLIDINCQSESNGLKHFEKSTMSTEINVLPDKQGKKTPEKMSQPLENITDIQKTRNDILADRKAKKLAKKSKEKPVIKSEIKKLNTANERITENLNSNVMNIEKKQTNIEDNQSREINAANKNSQSDETKSKAELRAERRLKQEQQRAAKIAVTVEKSTKIDVKSVKNIKEQTQKLVVSKNTSNLSSKAETPSLSKLSKFSNQHKVQLFNHLYVDRIDVSLCDESSLHASILKLGVQFATRVILGSNSRCIAMLNAIQDVISTHRTPTNEEFGRSLDVVLKKNVEYLQTCRPLSVSMTNSLRYLKWQITQLPNNIKDEDAKHKLLDFIDTFIREQIEMAIEAISMTVLPKIANNDVILTYGCSSLIEKILSEAHKSGKSFRVVVVDGRPLLEGREMLRRLVSLGIKCTYIMITAMNFIMPEVNKVLLGAHALLANGYVMSRAGTAQVALMANASNVPVLVCCETHKFSERVQTDSIVYNEIGEPDKLIPIEGNILSDWKNTSVIPLNLTYDVTPPDLVTAVVTEIAILPCTSVPVILRIRPAESTIYS